MRLGENPVHIRSTICNIPTSTKRSSHYKWTHYHCAKPAFKWIDDGVANGRVYEAELSSLSMLVMGCDAFFDG